MPKLLGRVQAFSKHVGTPAGDDKLFGVLWSTVAAGTPDYDYVYPNDRNTPAPAGATLLGWTAS